MKKILYILLLVPLYSFGQANPECESTTEDALGPYFLEGAPFTESIVTADYQGELLFISGNLTNNCETPVLNAELDFWQTDEDGEYDYDGYRYRGKILTDDEGNYNLETIIPGKYGNGSQFRPAHIHLKILVAGNDELVTQIYFEGDTDIDTDASASSPSAINRIIPISLGLDSNWYGTFDIVLSIENFENSTFYGCTNPNDINFNAQASVDDGTCDSYNLYPIEDLNFLAYLEENYPQTIINDSLNIDATTNIGDINVESLDISSLDGLQFFYDLINLNCMTNNLSTLPELPNQLENINCQWNQIISLPNFPESLLNFDGRHNLITVVPELPNTMEILRVCFNEVTTIPDLPDSLKILFCAYNYEHLTYLPDFPDHLEEVLCFDNEIAQISAIPETMHKFMMQNNSITRIPDIPEGVDILNISNNPIICVNDYPEQFEEQLEMYPPCNFLDQYTSLIDSLENMSEEVMVENNSLVIENVLLLENNEALMIMSYNFDSLQYVADDLSSQLFNLQQELLVPNINVDLAIGWNMIGFSCPEVEDVTDALIGIVDQLIVIKDNNGSVYLPEYDFNGIGDLSPGQGYQLKLSDYILNFNICE